MNITIICSDPQHKIFPYLEKWIIKNSINHNISLVTRSKQITKGDILFIISCTEIIKENIRKKFKHTLVIHESDLPKGRGWSPVSYQVEKGIMDIPVTLFEANQELDTGKWYIKSTIKLNGTELIDEIREKQFNVTLSMIKKFLTGSKEGNNQFGDETYYAKRSEDNQQLDISKSIENQFDKLRVCDNNRYPSHFSIRNQKYILKIYKKEDNV